MLGWTAVRSVAHRRLECSTERTQGVRCRYHVPDHPAGPAARSSAAGSSPPRDTRPLCWSTIAGLSVVHLGGIAGIVWLIVHPSLHTIGAAAFATS